MNAIYVIPPELIACILAAILQETTVYSKTFKGEFLQFLWFL